MTGRSAEFGELTLLALANFVGNCREGGHELCSSPVECERALESAIERADFEAAARRYDLGCLDFPPSTELPSHTWPTAALFRVVTTRLFDEPAWSRTAHRRTVWLTSALARLGERGIPADAVVRTYFGPRIKRQLIIEAVAAKTAASNRGGDSSRVPPTLRDWLSIVPDQASNDLVINCLTGPLSETVDAWVRNGALAHVIAWRRNADIVEIAHEDRVVAGGLDATRWLVDRFTRTALDDWLRPSLDWELAYLSDPQETARTVGVSASLVAERPVSESMVVKAISRRTREPSLADEILGGMTRVEIMENVVALTMRNERGGALDLVRRSLAVVPSDSQLEQALAFLQIPDDSVDSERRFRRLGSRRGADERLLSASVAICAIRQGRMGDAVAALREIATIPESRRYWLWTPATLAFDEPELFESTLADWSSEVLKVIEP